MTFKEKHEEEPELAFICREGWPEREAIPMKTGNPPAQGREILDVNSATGLRLCECLFEASQKGDLLRFELASERHRKLVHQGTRARLGERKALGNLFRRRAIEERLHQRITMFAQVADRAIAVAFPSVRGFIVIERGVVNLGAYHLRGKANSCSVRLDVAHRATSEIVITLLRRGPGKTA